MKKLLILLILLGITIYYDVDNQGGWVWVNASTNDCTILAYPKTNRVVWYSSTKMVFVQTYVEFVKENGTGLIENLKESPIIIHRNDPKESPKIVY